MRRPIFSTRLRFALAALAALCALGIASQGDLAGAPARSDGLVYAVGQEGLQNFAPIGMGVAIDRVAGANSTADAK